VTHPGLRGHGNDGGRGYQADGGRFDREIGCLVTWKVIVADWLG
jgi:hypothetical protein